MASRYRWRQQLLGSLQGQLQLATYLVVFLGFTGASSVGLLIGQRHLLANDQQMARQSIALCDKAIRTSTAVKNKKTAPATNKRQQSCKPKTERSNQHLMIQKLMPSTSYLMANPTETDTAVTGEVPMRAQQQTTTQV